MRAKGITWMKMPLFSWSVFISVFMLYMSLPAFIIGVAFLLFDTPLVQRSLLQVEIRYCSSICSGSLAIPKYTWLLFRPSELYQKFLRQVLEGLSLATNRWYLPWPVLESSGLLFGDTTC